MNSVSVEQYASRLARVIQRAIRKDVLTIAEEAMKDAIATTVYASSGVMYRQTMDLLSAVEISKVSISGGRATFEVGINPGALKPEIRMPGEWNAHAGMDGSAFQEGLVHTLDEGSSGSPYYNHEGYHFFDKAEETMEDDILDAMIGALRQSGYNITFT